VATTAGGTVTTTDLTYSGDGPAQEITNGVVTRTYLTDEAGTIVRFCDPDCTGSNPQYLVAWNGHGDAMNVGRINADGTLTLANSYRYDTWGRPTTTTHNGIADLGFRYLYVGAADVQWDNQLGAGLIYMHARTYHPALGRFLQPDPARADASLYGYTQNSPVTAADPSGLDPYFGHTRAEIEFCNPVNVWNATACVKNLAIGLWSAAKPSASFRDLRRAANRTPSGIACGRGVFPLLSAFGWRRSSVTCTKTTLAIHGESASWISGTTRLGGSCRSVFRTAVDTATRSATGVSERSTPER